jgi:hypothetical protein
MVVLSRTKDRRSLAVRTIERPSHTHTSQSLVSIVSILPPLLHTRSATAFITQPSLPT